MFFCQIYLKKERKSMKKLTITITGSSPVESKLLFGKAVSYIKKKLSEFEYDELTVMATGESDYNHIPVSLYLDDFADKIIFKLPTDYDLQLGAFVDNVKSRKIRIGHYKFGNIMGGITENGILRCLQKSKQKKDNSASASIVSHSQTRANYMMSDFLYIFTNNIAKSFPALIYKRQSPDKRHVIDLRCMKLDIEKEKGKIDKPNFNRLRKTVWNEGTKMR